MDVVKVKFTRDYVVKDEEALRYERGSVYEMSLASARHFVNRGAARVVSGGRVSEPTVTGKVPMTPELELAAMGPAETADMPAGKRK